jgi:hypothetical protein
MSWVIQSEEKAKAAGVTDEDEVLYAITVGDLVIAYEQQKGEGTWSQLSEEGKVSLTRRARWYMEGFCGEGSYNFADALRQAVEDETAERGRDRPGAARDDLHARETP